MGKHLTDDIVYQIVGIIDSWNNEKLTWPLLVQYLGVNLGLKYSRQTLCKHKLIADAFQIRKQFLREKVGVDPIFKSKQMQDAANTIEELKLKISRLEKQNNDLLEQFLRWLYNVSHATRLPITIDDLNKPLPENKRS